MLCMILCGGRGRRLAGVTDVPKPLLEIKPGVTILDWQLRRYSAAGFKRCILLTGYKHEEVERRYGSRFEGMEIEYVREEEPLGTLHAIKLGMEHAKEDAMISNGDVVAEIDLKRMWDKFERSGALVSIFITKLRSPYGIVKVRGRLVSSFVEKPLLNLYINGGYYCFSRKTLPYLRKFDRGDVEKTLFPHLAKLGRVVWYRERGEKYWSSIDTLKDLEETRKAFEQGLLDSG